MEAEQAVTGNVSPDGTEASALVRSIALAVLIGGLLYCLLLAGLAGWNHGKPFQIDVANFALFAAFVVVAGAIERFLEPIAAILPPYGKTPADKAGRGLLLTSFALIVGIVVSSVFGLYFLEAIGVNIGTTVSGSSELVIKSSGDKLLRGLDVFITALIITGGTKPLHDLISSIENKKEAAGTAGR